MVKATDISLKFRPGLLEDAAKIADLGRQTFIDFFDQIYRKSDLDVYLQEYFSEERVKSDLQDPDIEYRIAMSSNTMTSYAKIGTPSIDVPDDGETYLQLHRLYVKENRQGVGVGGILLQWAIERARERGASELCLGVWVDNNKAISFYESRGFVAKSTYDVSIGATNDKELFMSLKLKAAMAA